MISTLRPTAILRCLRSERIGPFALIACISLLVAPSAQAGLFDQFKQQATNAIQKKLQHALPSQPGSPSAPANPQPAASPSGQANQTPAARPSAATSQVPKNPNAVTLVRTFQPVIPSYSGASEDLLGVRLGMPMAQAEKIASKTYPGNPVVQRAKFRIAYKEVTVESQLFVQYVEYTKATANTTDQLLLGFNSPVGDSRVVSMERLINFAPHAADESLVSSIQASLFKKYGTPSGKNTFLGTQFWWAYSQKGRLPCQSGDCFGAYNATYGVGASTGGGRLTALHADGGEFNLSSDDDSIDQRCGSFIGNSNKLIADDVVRIWATISSNGADSSKASQMEIYAYYSQPCVDDVLDARSQMQAAALKRYHAISKTPAAPAF